VPCNNVKGTCQSGFCETPQTCGDGVKHSTEECDTGGDTACCRGCKLMFECDGLDATCCSNCRFQVRASPLELSPRFLITPLPSRIPIVPITDDCFLHLGLYQNLHDSHHEPGWILLTRVVPAERLPRLRGKWR
jgi:hypothetical protein